MTFSIHKRKYIIIYIERADICIEFIFKHDLAPKTATKSVWTLWMRMRIEYSSSLAASSYIWCISVLNTKIVSLFTDKVLTLNINLSIFVRYRAEEEDEKKHISISVLPSDFVASEFRMAGGWKCQRHFYVILINK